MKLKKILLSTKSVKNASEWTALMLRFGVGFIMLPHGIMKIKNFDAISENFVSFLGVSPSISLALAIFAEVVCSILLIMGLFTRLATIPLIITTFMIMRVKNFDIFWNTDNEIVLAFAVTYFAILLLGPGKHSFDNLLSK